MTEDEFLAGHSGRPVTYDRSGGHPAGSHLHYQCLVCRDVLPSQPGDNIHCGCGNLFIDADAARLGANRGDSSFTLWEAKRKAKS
jgi:hypothetical protein